MNVSGFSTFLLILTAPQTEVIWKAVLSWPQQCHNRRPRQMFQPDAMESLRVLVAMKKCNNSVSVIRKTVIYKMRWCKLFQRPSRSTFKEQNSAPRIPWRQDSSPTWRKLEFLREEPRFWLWAGDSSEEVSSLSFGVSFFSLWPVWDETSSTYGPSMWWRTEGVCDVLKALRDAFSWMYIIILNISPPFDRIWPTIIEFPFF